MQIEKVVLFMIEKEGLLAERLQRLRKRREDGSSCIYEGADESGLSEQSSFPVVVQGQMMDEYRYST
jgi:hypothetical protein